MIRIVATSVTTLSDESTRQFRTFDVDIPELEAFLKKPGMYTTACVVGAEIIHKGETS